MRFIPMLRNRPTISYSVALVAALLFAFSSSKASTQTDIAGPPGSVQFGSTVKSLPNGNFVVTDPWHLEGGVTTGAVYLYSGATLELISVLRGYGAGSGGIVVLPSGNFVVLTPPAAVTFCSMTAGCNGNISAANSVIATTANDQVGSLGINVLSNGNYVLSTPSWNGFRGAATFGSGTTGVSGEISASNSLVGVNPGDRVSNGTNGGSGISMLPNGNYVVLSPSWNTQRGAATFCPGTVPCVGTITSSNSLVGTTPVDFVANTGVTVLANGNYVVGSKFWSDGDTTDVGAVTWGSGITGVVGEVSAANSVVGSHQDDEIGGFEGITPLANGNYVMSAPRWNGSRGFVMLGNGSTGSAGVVSSANSLVGNNPSDTVGSEVKALTNGNYVVASPTAEIGGIDGFVTFGNGTTGVTGPITTENSFAGGSYGGTSVVPLTNGNYVITTSSRSAVTFASGTTGITGSINETNSLIGGNVNGSEFRTFALPNGNYVICNPDWRAANGIDYGAVTFGNGNTGVSGIVSSSNSLIGSQSADGIGHGGIVPLSTGNFVIKSPKWHGWRGAATFASGTNGITGVVGPENSLVGLNANEGAGGVINALPNGNYVVVNSQWNSVRGAVTFGNGQTGVSGEVSAANSLIGSDPNDNVGGGNNGTGVISGPNSSFVVSSHNWNGSRGAATYVNGTSGISGVVSSQNSLVGTAPSDLLSNGDWGSGPLKYGTVFFEGGKFAIFSTVLDNGPVANAGSVTLGLANRPLTGEVNTANSVRESVPDMGRYMSFDYDRVNRQFIVGRRGSKIVSIFKPDEGSNSPFDFDGDGKTDLSIFRPGPGEWWWLRSSDGGNSALQFGASTDRLAPVDFTGDGKTDVAFWRPGTGQWFVLRSEDFSFYAFPFGANGDVPVPADFDGDGKADPAVFRESSSTWFINKSSGGTDIVGFGSAGDKTAVADYDGDGKADVAIFRPVGVSGAEWWVRRSSNAVVVALQFGASTDKAVPGDFTGDGKADIAFWRPSTGFWNVLRSEDLSYFAFPFGTTGDVPVAGDYDGDGKTDAGVFRPSNSTWFIQRSTAGTLIQQFGAAGDVPLPSSFVR